MTRTAEEQVEAAWQAFRTIPGLVPCGENFRIIATALLAGKFAEDPLPEIIPPPWPTHTLEVIKWGHTYYVVHCMSRASIGDNWPDFHGPERPTKLEAIEAWNAGMRG